MCLDFVAVLLLCLNSLDIDRALNWYWCFKGYDSGPGKLKRGINLLLLVANTC